MILPKGPYSHGQLRFLSTLLSRTSGLVGNYLEVGSLAGKSAVVIGLAAKAEGDRLFCVDIWDSGEWKAIAAEIGERSSLYPERPADIFNVFKANIKAAGLQGTVQPIVDRSENVLAGWSDPLRFIHIDGCHEYEFVKRDTGWKEHLIKGGVICFHDYGNLKAWPGGTKAVDEGFNQDSRFERIGRVGSLVAFRRIA